MFIFIQLGKSRFYCQSDHFVVTFLILVLDENLRFSGRKFIVMTCRATNVHHEDQSG